MAPTPDPAVPSWPSAVLALVEEQRLPPSPPRARAPAPWRSRGRRPRGPRRSSQASQISAPSIIGVPARSVHPTPSHFSRMRVLGAEPPRELRLVGGEHVDPEHAARARPRPGFASRGRGRRASSAARARARRRRWPSRRPARSGPMRGDHRHAGRERGTSRSRRASGSTCGWHQLTRFHGHGGGKYDAARVRPVLVTTAAVAAALVLAACGSEGISVSKDDPTYRGAVLFSQRCAGCHTLTAAGTQGSANRAVRVQGPNLDQRVETLQRRHLRDPQRRLLGRDHAPEHRHRPRGRRGRQIRLQVRGIHRPDHRAAARLRVHRRRARGHGASRGHREAARGPDG